jgi:hypothetical protein
MTRILSKFRAGDGERRFGGGRGGAAKAHALEWPLDVPSGVGEACEEIGLGENGIKQ